MSPAFLRRSPFCFLFLVFCPFVVERCSQKQFFTPGVYSSHPAVPLAWFTGRRIGTCLIQVVALCGMWEAELSEGIGARVASPSSAKGDAYIYISALSKRVYLGIVARCLAMAAVERQRYDEYFLPAIVLLRTLRAASAYEHVADTPPKHANGERRLGPALLIVDYRCVKI